VSDLALGFSLAAFQLAVNCFSNEIGALFFLSQNTVDPVKRTGRESSRRLLIIDPPATHC
jgi:hypothetical protein